jgi:hypothetical protein
MPKIPKEVLDQLVGDGTMTAEQVNATTMTLKKALVERALVGGCHVTWGSGPVQLGLRLGVHGLGAAAVALVCRVQQRLEAAFAVAWHLDAQRPIPRDDPCGRSRASCNVRRNDSFHR